MANPTVLLETTSGDILIELYADKAPATVENFLKYVNEGFYANTIFHRVIKGFMIQGGGMNMKMEEKATHAPIKNEADNGLANERGTIAMARTRDPHSATAQFFINTVDNGFLNFSSPDVNGYGYCVFGKVIEGMEAVDKIEKEKTATRGIHSDVPVSAQKKCSPHGLLSYPQRFCTFSCLSTISGKSFFDFLIFFRHTYSQFISHFSIIALS